MLILTLRTDKPEAEIGLYEDDRQIAHISWQAHRLLAETLHQKISTLLQDANHTLHELDAVACYQGPGSFTGLRIGISVANALAYGLAIPIAGAEGEEWLLASIQKLTAGQGATAVMPLYGSPVHITPPRA
jgi:tRNA threonylcarbamoyladenosine biosynthesis protein TsaB